MASSNNPEVTSKSTAEVGEGTTIKVYLPRTHVSANVTKAEIDVPVVGSLGSETVLVVEDEADVRSYLVETLQDLNYRVREAPDGAGRACTVRFPIRSGSICF